MSADRITVADPLALEEALEIADASIHLIRLQAENGDISPEEAAAEVNAVIAKLNSLAR